jgi:hypothetical protein
MGSEGSPRDTDERLAELERELHDLRSVTGVEALELRAQLRAAQRRIDAIEMAAGQANGVDSKEERGLDRKRRRIAEAKAGLAPEELDRIRQQRAEERADANGAA